MSFLRPTGYRLAILIIISLYLLVRASFTLIAIIDGNHPEWRDLLSHLASFSLFFSLSFVMFCIIARTREAGIVRQIAVAAVAAVVAASIYTPALQFLFSVIRSSAVSMWQHLIQRIISNIGLFSLVAACLVGLLHYLEARDRARQLALAKGLTLEARTLALRYQVDPHFLFNALNSISTLILDDRKADAERMLLRLSNFFRLTLSLDPKANIPLAQEIELQRAYLLIEQERLQDGLHVDINLPASLEEARVPSLILQPLFENAIKHGWDARKGELLIRMNVYAQGEQLFVDIENTRCDHARPGTGSGLRNIRGRLSASFGEQASLLVDTPEPELFRARLQLPLRFDGQSEPLAHASFTSPTAGITLRPRIS